MRRTLLSLGAVGASAMGMGACAPTPAPPPAPTCEPQVPATRACDLPAQVDPSAVLTRDEFLEAASRLVCDRALRGEGTLGWLAQSFCLPGFAAEYTAAGSGAYDAEAGRDCLRALITAPGPNTAEQVALSCLAIAQGLGGPCGATCWAGCVSDTCRMSSAGEACYPSPLSNPCAPGLVCDGGLCRALATPGTPCASDDDCDLDLLCTDGACALGLALDAACDASLRCAPGLACERARCAPAEGEIGGCCGRCNSGRCVDGHCAPVGHLGCACESDSDCPHDVSRCIAGVCVGRPLRGASCDPDGAPCFGSVCHVSSRTCAPGVLGEGPCGAAQDCETGLFCSGGWLRSPGICSRTVSIGEACGSAGLVCTAGVCDGSTCRYHGAGEPCGSTSDCEPALQCHGLPGVCAQAVRNGQPCAPPNVVCEQGVCDPGSARCVGGRGQPCSVDAQCMAGLRCRSNGHAALFCE